MEFKLYGSVFSRTFRCIWTFHELEIPFEHISVALNSDELRSKDFLSKNPNGKVPVLQVDDQYIFESAAICSFLAQQRIDKFLIPAEGTIERAKCEQWLFFVMSELEQPLWTIAKHGHIYKEDKRVEAVISTAIWEFEQAYRIIEKSLGNNDYILNEFTLADIFIAQTFFWANKTTGIEIDSEVIQNYLQKLKSRPHFPNIKKYI